MKLRWAVSAKHPGLYRRRQSARAAIRMDELFAEAALKLTTFPQMGHAGKIAGTRELIPHEHYRLVYQIKDDVVWVLALMHTARQWPPRRDEDAS